MVVVSESIPNTKHIQKGICLFIPYFYLLMLKYTLPLKPSSK